MISLEYEACSGKLGELISSFYSFQYRGDPTVETERADRAQIRFYLRGQGEYRFATGDVDSSYDVTIVGPTTQSYETTAEGNMNIFGWGLTPAGWAALMGSQAGKWADRAFDARIIFGDSILELHREIKASTNLLEQAAIAKAASAKIFKNAQTAPFEFTTLVDNWLIRNIDPVVDELAVASGLSIRQLERMTKRFYGMPPKKLARKYRALRAAHALANGDRLDENNMGVVFHDQSHLIREVKQFTGLTPGQLKAGASPLTRATMRGRSALAGKVNLLVSES
jgi:AraC-like DNA-binding protein